MSRNYIVWDHHKNLVYKTFASPVGFQQELACYALLRDTHLVPKHHSPSLGTLALSYIPGETLHNLPVEERYFALLVKWYLEMEQHIFQQTGRYCCLEDCNFSNFLVTDDGMVGIDFEHWHYGTAIDAFALPLAHIWCMQCHDIGLKNRIFRQMLSAFCEIGLKKQALMAAVQHSVTQLEGWRQIRPQIAVTGGVILTSPKTDSDALAQLEYAMGCFDHVAILHAPTRQQIKDGLIAQFGQWQGDFLFFWHGDDGILTKKMIIDLFHQSHYDAKHTTPTKQSIPWYPKGVYPYSQIIPLVDL